MEDSTKKEIIPRRAWFSQVHKGLHGSVVWGRENGETVECTQVTTLDTVVPGAEDRGEVTHWVSGGMHSFQMKGLPPLELKVPLKLLPDAT